jgi:hypothetical protein
VCVLLAAGAQGIEITPDEVLVDSALSRIRGTMQGSGANKDYGALWAPVWTYLYEDVELDNKWAKGNCHVGGGSKPAPNNTLDASLGSWASVTYSMSAADSKYAGGYLYQGASATAEAIVYFKMEAHPSWLGRLTGQRVVYVEITANHQLSTRKTDRNDTSPFAIAGLAIGKKHMRPGAWISGLALKQYYNRTEDGTEQLIEAANEAGQIGYDHDEASGKGSLTLYGVPITIGEEYQMNIWTQASAWVSVTYNPAAPSKEAESFASIDPVIELDPGTPDPDGLRLLVSANLYQRSPGEQELAIEVSQGGMRTDSPDPGKGPVTITAGFLEHVPNATTKYIWFSENDFTDTDNSPLNSEYVFDPEGLQPGNYTIGVLAIHSSLGRATKEATLRIGTSAPTAETIALGIILVIIAKPFYPRLSAS